MLTDVTYTLLLTISFMEKGPCLSRKVKIRFFSKSQWLFLFFFLVHPAVGSKPDSAINEEMCNNGLIPFTRFF